MGGEAPPSGVGRGPHRVPARCAARRAPRPLRGQPHARREGGGVGPDRQHRPDGPGEAQGGPRRPQDDAAVRAGAARRRRRRRDRRGFAAALGSRGPGRGARARRGARHPVAVSASTSWSTTRRRRAEEAGSPWMHTHGLQELGAFDLDVLAAHPTFVASSPDLFRALAFRALGGDIAPGADRVLYAYPRFELAPRAGGPVHARGGRLVARAPRRRPPRRAPGGAVRAVGQAPVRPRRRGSARAARARASPVPRAVRGDVPDRGDRAHGPPGRGDHRRVSVSWPRSSSPTGSTSSPSSASRRGRADASTCGSRSTSSAMPTSTARSSIDPSTSTSARAPAPATRSTCSPTGRS